MTDLTNNAWAAVPAISQLEQALAALDTIRIPPAASVGEVQAAITERLVAGELLDGDHIVALMTAAQTAEQPRQAARQAIGNARVDLTHRLAQTRKDNADRALVVLADELAELISAGRPLVKKLAGVSTAEAAIRKGNAAATAWTELADLAARYDAIRGAQRTVTVDGYGRHGGPEQGPIAIRDIERFGIVADATNYPPLTGELTGGPKRIDGAGSAIVAAAPWPTGDGLAFLRWAIDNNAKVWLPTVPQLRGAVSDHATAVNEARARAADPDGQAAQRARAAQARVDREADVYLREAATRQEIAAHAIPHPRAVGQAI